jgi:transcriptional regulator with XRE-family HTH domain
MQTQYHHLRLYRNQSALTQTDIASLLGLTNFSSISRWEQGKRKPNVIMLLVYHFVFNIPIEEILEPLKYELKPLLIERMQALILHLKKVPSEPTTNARIAFLEAAIIRIASQPV